MKTITYTGLLIFLLATTLIAQTMVSVSEEKYQDLKDKAAKWDESQKKKDEKPPAEPQVPKRSRLNINILNKSGFPAKIRMRVRPSDKPTEFLDIQSRGDDQRTTLGTLFAAPDSTFKIITQGDVPAFFQLITSPGMATEQAPCKLSDLSKKEAKKSIDAYIFVPAGESHAQCELLYDNEL